MEIAKFIDNSAPLAYRDLDWQLAAEVGLTDEEKLILTYFADVEGQTIFYLRELLDTSASRDDDALAFLTLWNYEEFFHSHALATLLEACGAPLGNNRRGEVRVGARFAASAERAIQTAMSKALPEAFVTLYMAWGASQELLTLRGYERIASSTRNPVLAELCQRIAKQERRHFAWYYNTARERLAGAKWSQRYVRFIFERFWSPVGIGVKSRAEAAILIDALFPGEILTDVMGGIDAKLARWPGMEGFAVVSTFAAGLAPSADVDAAVAARL